MNIKEKIILHLSCDFNIDVKQFSTSKNIIDNTDKQEQIIRDNSIQQKKGCYYLLPYCTH